MNFALSLLHLLSRQLPVYTRFLALLREEQATLAQAQPEALENCTAERGRLVATLEAQDQELRTLFANAKITFSAHAVTQLLTTLAEPQRSQLTQQWQQVLSLVGACNRQNAINSKIVDTRRKHTERVLRILMGQTTLAGSTYAADGRVQPGATSAELATV